MCLQQELISLTHTGFENTKFNEISGIGIPWVLNNIMSCRGFVKEENKTFELTCRRNVFS